MPKVKATNAYKIQSILTEFPEKFMKSPTTNYIAIFATVRFVLDSRSEQLIPHTSQTFLKSSDTNFVENVTKAFLSADIPLYKLCNKHMRNLFCDIGHSLPSETTCRQTVL